MKNQQIVFYRENDNPKVTATTRCIEIGDETRICTELNMTATQMAEFADSACIAIYDMSIAEMQKKLDSAEERAFKLEQEISDLKCVYESEEE